MIILLLVPKYPARIQLFIFFYKNIFQYFSYNKLEPFWDFFCFLSVSFVLSRSNVWLLVRRHPTSSLTQTGDNLIDEKLLRLLAERMYFLRSQSQYIGWKYAIAALLFFAVWVYRFMAMLSLFSSFESTTKSENWNWWSLS